MLALQGLRFDWGTGATLAFPDLDLAQGGALLLTGPSGSGKSTLLALVAALLTPSAGRLQVAGEEPARMTRAERDRWRGATLGFMPQRLHLSESLSVRRNLELPFIAAGAAVDGARIDSLLAELGLHGLAQRRPHELSLGQAQRVAMARALLRRPRLLLADEPSANLDDGSTAAVLALLQRSAREAGATLVVATHDARVRDALAAAAVLRLAGNGAVR